MLEKYKELNKLNKKFEEDLKSYVKDQSIPLDERWKTFIECGIGNTDWRTDFDGSIDEENLYEAPLYMMKYETSDVKHMYEVFTSEEDCDECGIVLDTVEKQEKFKNYCLNNFVIRMKFDW